MKKMYRPVLLIYIPIIMTILMSYVFFPVRLIGIIVLYVPLIGISTAVMIIMNKKYVQKELLRISRDTELGIDGKAFNPEKYVTVPSMYLLSIGIGIVTSTLVYCIIHGDIIFLFTAIIAYIFCAAGLIAINFLSFSFYRGSRRKNEVVMIENEFVKLDKTSGNVYKITPIYDQIKLLKYELEIHYWIGEEVYSIKKVCTPKYFIYQRDDIEQVFYSLEYGQVFLEGCSRIEKEAEKRRRLGFLILGGCGVIFVLALIVMGVGMRML